MFRDPGFPENLFPGYQFPGIQISGPVITSWAIASKFTIKTFLDFITKGKKNLFTKV